MGLCSLPVVSTACDVGSSVAGGVADDFIKTAATDAANAANSILQTLVTAWTAVPTQLGGAQAGAATSLIQGDLLGVEVWVGVIGVIVAAARMALFRRGEPFRQVVSGLLNMIVIGGAGIVAINLLATAGDGLSNYLLSNGFGQANNSFNLGLAVITEPFLLLVLSILAIVSLLVQVALIILRSALLVVLAGVWPVAAAASMTSAGAQWFRKLNGWILAFLLYKPAAAVCYAAAFKLMQGGGLSPVMAQIEGVVLIILATLTLPALLRFVVPLVSSVGGVSGGEIVATGAALAAGAAAVVATAGAAAPAAGGAASGTGAAGAAGPSGSALASAVAPAGAASTNGATAGVVRDAARGLGQTTSSVTKHAENGIAGGGEEDE